MNNELSQLRSKIDALDVILLETLAKRARLVQKIGHYKKARQIATLDSERWRQVLENNISKGKSLGLCPDFIVSIYELIHTYSLDLEDHLVEEESFPPSLTLPPLGGEDIKASLTQKNSGDSI